MADSVYNLVIKVQADAAGLPAVESGLRKVAAAEETMSMATNRAAGNTINLKRQLGDVGTMAAMGASPMMILTSQADQLAMAFEEAKILTGNWAGVMSAWMPIAAGVALQVAAVALVVKGYSADEKEAALATKQANDAIQAQKPIVEATRLAMIDLWVALGDITEAEGKMQKAHIAAFDALQKSTEQARAKLSELRKEQGSVLTQAVDMAPKWFTAYTPLGKAVDWLTTSSEEYQTQIDKLNEAVTTGIERTHESVVVTDELAKAEEAAKQAKERSTAASRASAEATKAENEAKRQAAELARLLEKGHRDYADALILLRNVAADSPVEKENLRYEQLVASIEEAIGITGDYQTGMEALDAAGKAHVDNLDAIRAAQDALTTSVRSTTTAYESEADARLRGATSAVSAVGGGANGLLGALGQAGPYGGLIASILSLIENLDQTLAGINDFLGNFTDQIARLPETVGNFVGELLTQVLPGLIDAVGSLLETLPAMVSSLIGSVSEMVPALLGSVMDLLFDSLPQLVVNLIASLFDADMWVNAGKSLVKGFTDNFAIKKGEEGAAVGNILTGGLYGAISGALKGSAASGLDRTQEGLYYLHKDEQVVNRARADQAEQGGGMATRGRMVGYGGKVTIEIDPTSLAQTMTGLGQRGYTFGTPS